MIECDFKDGKENGLRTNWHKNGQLELEGYYKNGVKDGIWRQWNDNGQLRKEEKYALRTEAIRYLRQFGFTLGQLERASDNQILETYQAYSGDVQMLSEVTEQTVYDHDELVMYRWRKLAGFGG